MALWLSPKPDLTVLDDGGITITMVAPEFDVTDAAEGADAPDNSATEASPEDAAKTAPSPNSVAPVSIKSTPVDVASGPDVGATSLNDDGPGNAPEQTSGNQVAPTYVTTSQPAASSTLPAVASSGRSHTKSYMAQVRTWIERHKTYPRGAKRLRQEGGVIISFTLDRQGRVLSSRVVKSSGIAAFDREALDVLKRAEPMPKPPKDVKGDVVEMTTELEFSLQN
ncbi:TonB family protein [Asticcacaulis sp. ZE23SCel15]|uniref:energy transducer TonB n=1 Tax=Asticcacaulis sp. ZE23SCel15 TaxID=3059027 RepID=UPI00265FACFC|nr:TonB family protein [Asticcacaulis sp. ZE23SCel15]WKL56751.1 TonB family protein [Asticcacaulis sp. ZE23SCel15]